MTHDYLIAFGSNIEPRSAFLEDALDLIEENCGVIFRCSSFLETEPIGAADQAFLNGVLWLRSEHHPESLLNLLQSIEAQLGRKRSIHWGNRTIDLDIIEWKYLGIPRTVENETLKIPHPLWKERDFVKIPLMEIAPNWADFLSDLKWGLEESPETPL